MTDSTARDDNTADAAGSTEVSVVIPADLNRLPIPRSIAATLAAALDFDIDAVADLRIAVDEMVSTVIVRARPGSQVTTVFRAQSGGIAVECSAASDDRGDIDERSFGWMVLSTLAEDLRARVDGVAEDGPHLKLSMTMRIPRGVQ
jgi:serine/threonine-protein kinase RsbW